MDDYALFKVSLIPSSLFFVKTYQHAVVKTRSDKKPIVFPSLFAS
jgi:hypothetical protein